MLRKKTISVVATIALLAVMCSVAVSLPAPAPMMILARTVVDPTLHPSVVEVGGRRMEGLLVSFDDFSVTTDADTTATMYIGGLIPWRVINETGGAVTLTFYDSREVDGNELSLVDQDDVAIPSITVGNDESQELPSGMAGCMYLVVKGGGAADGLTLVCKR